MVRELRERRNADFEPAVSQVFNLQGVPAIQAGVGASHGRSNAIRRYSRFKICVTGKRRPSHGLLGISDQFWAAVIVSGMARKLRVQYAGAIYHVVNRGDRREEIFEDDADRPRILETLSETCGKTGWQAHACCLMPNHSHLVVETPQPSLVAGMKWLLRTCTGRFNRRHKLSGHLLSGR